jgi:hypothetical protein
MSDQLPPHARAMLDALQREDTPDSAEQRRVKQQVFARLGLGAIGAVTATASSVVSHAATTASSTAVGGAAMATSGASAGSPLGAAVGSVGAGTASAGTAGAGTTAATGITSLLAAKLGTTKLVLGLTTVLATAGGAALLSETLLSETLLSETQSSRTHSAEATLSDARSSRAQSTEHRATPAPSVAASPIVSRQIVRDAQGPTEAPQLPHVEQNPPGSRSLVTADAASRAPEAVSQSRSSGARPAPTSSLQEEAQLLGLAHQKISQGQPAAALSVLTEHQRRFPRGTLALERQAAFAVAHCLNGETSRGRAEAERFRRKYPTSPMVKRLVSACQLSEP